ncbi:carboxypeptidase regulatory-like domain-containing protein [Paracoccus sp. 11-3]|uniref:Carboxypeptidase regulatory-like domain-containing protein n=1 Tax=Paracoccus amoyensis TaxID=2760093 RepID=A0A926JE64_9RHOB|nr:SdrD B-like domain-containing protein [Paracoccus amoyensis]MBC9248544.1 carboxypeptidase regulatory-like domain-containing protein [Paracoccus amoyensis]
MTYYSSQYYKSYQWSAFTEADLLANGKNGTSIDRGDTFTVGIPTTKMSTTDNDATLSGDSTNCWWGTSGSSDRSGQNAKVNGVAVGCKMYAEQYHVLKGSDGKTYYMIEIKIEGHDSAGAGNGYFTFYGAQPPIGTSVTVVSTCNVSGSWVDYSCLGAGTTAPPNTPPTFTNVPANGIYCVNENNKLVVDLNASDKEGDALSFSIVGGADGASFTIDAKTGVLSFVNAPDYEKPTDSDGNNSYKVIVAVSDGKGGVTNKELTVNVCDVKEDGAQKCIVIEAEDMRLSCYTVKGATSASGGEYISLTGYNGSASTTFKGAAGEYDFSIRYWDAARGDGYIKVLVNGQEVKSIRLNTETGKWMDVSVDDLNLKYGDVITLKGSGKGCEYAIIDKIKLCPSEPEIKPGALEGRVFIDANKDGIDNNETGVSGVTVQLLNAAGAVVATMQTGADGSYKFNNLQPGDYSVVFPTEVDGMKLTDANVGGDDTVDSDANVTTGATGSYTVPAGGLVSHVDAGLYVPNAGPDASDDASGTCVSVAKTVNVLANDTDADGDSLTITKVDGQAITEGQSVTLDDGVIVTLSTGQLVFDASGSDYASLTIGQKANATYSYEISDGNGGIDTANVDMSYCGSLNTLETIKASLPEAGVIKLSMDTTGGEFYTAAVSGTGDQRFDGKSFDIVFCGAAQLPIKMGVNVPVTFHLATAEDAPASIVNEQNLDLVNWILNQDFTSIDNGDGTGKTYTEAEIQGAIWGLTDNFLFVNEANPTFGTKANAQEIYNLALANGEGFEAGEGDIIGLIVDPTAAAIAAGNKQPMIIGVEWNDLAEDCLCF